MAGYGGDGRSSRPLRFQLKIRLLRLELRAGTWPRCLHPDFLRSPQKCVERSQIQTDGCEDHGDLHQHDHYLAYEK